MTISSDLEKKLKVEKESICVKNGKRVGLKTKSVWVLKGNQVGTDAKLRQKRLTFIPRRLPFNEDITSSELNALTNAIVLCHRNHDEVSLRQ